MTPVTDLGADWAHPDFVVAADVVYHRELFGPLLSSLQALGEKREVLLCQHSKVSIGVHLTDQQCNLGSA